MDGSIESGSERIPAACCGVSERMSNIIISYESKFLHSLLRRALNCMLKVFFPEQFNMNWRLIIILLLSVNLLYACTGHHTKTVRKTKGVYHRVKAGDTLWSIAKAYNINVQDVAEANNITDPKLIGQNSIIFIPEANQVIDDVISSVSEKGSSVKTAQKEGKTSALKPGKEVTPVDKVPVKTEDISSKDASKSKGKVSTKEDSKSRTKKSIENISALTGKLPPGNEAEKSIENISALRGKLPPGSETEQKVEQKGREKEGGGDSEKLKFDKERFIWPVKGKVRSGFGIQPNGMYHNGIKIAAKEGTPVLAAANGIVIFSNSLKDYGDTIIIKHEDNYATVYTNVSKRIVRTDDHIKKGGRIALLGKLENKGEAYLNFEIRHKNKARNPLFFLP
jgi:lipoprotein NlpD